MHKTTDNYKYLLTKSKNIYLVFFLFINFTVCLLFGNEIKIITDGVQQEYFLGSSLIDSSSIEVLTYDSLKCLNWTYNNNKQTLFFNEAPDSGIIFTIKYFDDFLKFPQKINLYNKNYISLFDTFHLKNDFSIVEMKKEENLDINGFKTFSVSVDNNGAVFLEQGLDIRIGGYIRPGTELSAHISDQSSSIENTTKEISEFDLIYLQLKDPSFSLIAGDQYINRNEKSLYSDKKKIKGISASLKKTLFDVNLFGSFTGGSFIIENINCKEGLAGPYFFKGKGENGYIQPINGTVKIKHNGKELKENIDYSIDYNFGSVTLENNILIRNNDILISEYEYKLFDYQQFLYGLNTGISFIDSSLHVKGSLWVNSDNKNNPIDRTFTENELNRIKNIGDTLPLLSSEIKVDSKDVSSYSQIYPLYKKAYNQYGGYYFVYSQYNLNSPENKEGYYQVWFTDVGENNGEYNIDTVILSSVVFEIFTYKGEKQGRYTSNGQVSTPQRNITGELTTEYVHNNFNFNLMVAGENCDKNTFSSKDDKDNNSSAVKMNFLIGKKKDTKVWLSGSYNYNSQNFTNDIFSKYELKNIWNDTNQYVNSDNHYYNLLTGFFPVNWLQTEIAFGQRINGFQLKSSKLSNQTKLFIGKSNLCYNGFYSNYNNSNDFNNHRFENLSLTIPFNNITNDFLVSEEWENKKNRQNTGNVKGKIGVSYLPIPISESFIYESYQKGLNLFNSRDTSHSYIWEQNIICKPLTNWNVNGHSYYLKNVTEKKYEETTLLIRLDNEYSFKNVLISQTYSTSFEKASSFIQIPVYAGKGLGTYMYDSILKEFVPHIPGDWYMQEQELSDELSNLRVKKTELSFKWSLEPWKNISGILSDLFWEGNLELNEQLDAEEKRFISWIPGIYSLKNYKDSLFAKNKIQNAELSYRQDLTLRPKNNKHFSITSFIVPSLKKVRTFYESSLGAGLSYYYVKDKIFFSSILLFKKVTHDDNSNFQDLMFKDFSDEFTEKYNIIKSMPIYFKENIGFTSQTGMLKSKISVFENSRFYYQFTPGIQWQSEKAINADISYTYSYVPFIENKDYRIAQGFKSGKSHIISLEANAKAGKNIILNSMYRYENNYQKKVEEKREVNQVFSLEAKVVF